MRFNMHSTLAGRHAFLSPSAYRWIRYDEEKLDRVYNQTMAAQRGTRLHALAQQLIKEGVKLPDNGQTMSMYVNDAIGFKMSPEPTFFYSDNCYGSPDAASYSEAKKILRIHDLKTGINEASMDQLLIYTSLFCLEYKKSPLRIDVELRIYQNNEVKVYVPDPDEIFHIMDRIKIFDRRINDLRSEGMI